jgi:hypothetical protein
VGIKVEQKPNCSDRGDLIDGVEGSNLLELASAVISGRSRRSCRRVPKHCQPGCAHCALFLTLEQKFLFKRSESVGMTNTEKTY